MKWEVATAQAIAGRSRQEDALGVFGAGRAGPLILALADGAGGHAGGDLASRAAIECVERRSASAPHDPDAANTWLSETVAEADRAVASLAGGPGGPRTTLVVAWMAEDRLCFASVGDSRLYHFRQGRLLQRTRDDSLVQLLVDTGRIREEDVPGHPDRSRLLKALGGGEAASIAANSAALDCGDGLVLCSDGVWEHIGADEFSAALGQPSLDEAARRTVEKAVSRGGPDADNASLVLARVV